MLMVPICYWLKCGVSFIFFVLKTCFKIPHSLTPDFHGVMCFLLCSYFCNVTVLLHLLLYVFGLHILSACVGLFSFFIPIFCCLCVMIVMMVYIYRVSQEESVRLRESVPYVKLYRYNPKHLYPKLNGYGDNGQRSLKL